MASLIAFPPKHCQNHRGRCKKPVIALEEWKGKWRQFPRSVYISLWMCELIGGEGHNWLIGWRVP